VGYRLNGERQRDDGIVWNWEDDVADTTFLVGRLVGMTPAAEDPEATLHANTIDQGAITLDSGAAVTAPGPLIRQWQPTLHRLMSLGLPASFEIDTSTGEAVALRLPFVSRVRRLDDVDDRSVVTLLREPVEYELRRSDERQRQVLEVLEEAREKDREVLVTIDRDSRTILEATMSPTPSAPLVFLSVPPAAAVLSGLVPVASANLMPVFEELNQRNCPHSTVTSDDWCFPLKYHDIFCNTIASVVCHLLKARGIARAKLWLKGDMLLETDTHPSCGIEWDTHVAALVRLRAESDQPERLAVIDPAVSLTGPVLTEDWQARLTRTPSSPLVAIPSPPEVFWLESPTNYLTEREDDVREELDSMRTAYGQRIAEHGLPPYACGD
jgi:hypothetical protein